MITRREWLGGAAAAAGLALGRWLPGASGRNESAGPCFGMCDWSIGRVTDPSAFELGRQIGLDGIEVSIGYPKDGLRLRQPAVQKEIADAARRYGMVIPSVAMGVLNDVPLMSEPRAALWVADAIHVAKNLGAGCILLAFFGRGELKAENEADMRRVTEVLTELAPRAEKAAVTLGIESYLTAEAHLKILDGVKSPRVQVYYDVYNSGVTRGYDVRAELRLLGPSRICQVHFKEGPDYLGGGKVDWPGVAATLREIGYKGWIVLETSSPRKDAVADTRRNLEFARRLFVVR